MLSNYRIHLIWMLMIVSPLSIVAQSETMENGPDLSVKPVEGHWGVTFNVNGLIDNISVGSIDDPVSNPSLMVRKYIKDDLALRFGFGFTSISKEFSTVDSVLSSRVEADSTFKKTDFFISPGIEQHFLSSKRLDPYVGAMLNFGILGKTKTSNQVVTSDTTGTATFDLDSELDGGFAFGFNLAAGFNYFFSHNLSLGAEYTFGFNSLTQGGDFVTVIIDTPISGSSSTTRRTRSDRTTTSGFQVNSTAGVTLSYFFTRRKSG